MRASEKESTAATGKQSLGPSFWRLFVSSSTSNLSDGVLNAALPLLAATLTRDPVAVSALASLAFLPWLLFALPAGTLVDRVNRRRAMAVANVLRASLLALLAISVTGDIASMPILYAAAFLLGCVETVYDSAARAMLPGVISRGQLEKGNSLLSTGESVGNIFLGAPVGAWLFAIAATVPLWANAGAYLLAAGLIVTVVGRFRPPRTEKTTVRHDMSVALRWLGGHPILRSLMITTGISGLLQSMVNGILVLFALQDLGLTQTGFGILLAVAGVGAVLGSIFSPQITALVGRTNAMGGCELIAAASLVMMGLLHQPVVGMIGFAVSAAGISAFNVQIMSVRQALIPEHMFGRVQGAYRTVIWGGIPLGSLVGGAIGSWLGLPAVFVISGGLGMLSAGATWMILHHHRTAIAAAFHQQ